ncbi:hypothetical protein BEN47_08385 [Hymenobacter lapidarius]|uniref:Uncharacterized protein n=1 Tax=Hymenobacter lapidarius TaxID=1908237 RepID=A0A1G1TD05_9BACT|nr:hypothetical protein [Hymenobacter lapidarius]OGX88753.1 hypothetical protein BEN47_08385 [Hymenobacter lapidarius]
MRSISFNPAMLAAVQAGHKTVTRRRLPPNSPLQQEPDRYRFVELSAQGALFEDCHALPPALLPSVPLPFGAAGTQLSVQENLLIRLELRSVLAEQVRSLTTADALAEGIQARPLPGPPEWGGVEPIAGSSGAFRWYSSPIAAFQGLFESIYPMAWARNEWVWMIEFRVLPIAWVASVSAGPATA